MQNVTDRTRNPFGMRPDCRSFVPGYGDANADFHVVGDHPGVHGGVEAGVPFTGEPWSPAFLSALAEGGLIAGVAEGTAPDGTAATGETTAATSDETAAASDGGGEGDPVAEPIRTERTYFSYLHMCVPDGDPTAASYDDMERFFDAELRAIAAHVLLPVGARATEHVLEQYTARAWKTEVDMDALHGEEILGSGWLVLPIKDPAEWEAGDADRLVDGLRELRSTDFRRESDLGRFIAGSDPYLVR
ncbi:uracil-DNA glycosylase family protein [Halorubrum sp. CBA1229]|uniref:uracil-DNA glycosylase family protein n=1 Tax=Halorubrum sp. CBA1229 TaxID=1853699 RepID=UPI000F3C9E77|nr:uracil-DNA glycosylase family protein [Halorubrum sp. CBA1229]QKY15918.1 uracil-DNA glycosylase [Halorubrum sp. CBA1229]